MSSTEQQIDDAVAKRHVQNTDTSLGVQSADLDMNLHKIIALDNPVGDRDAAHKKYVDDAVGSGPGAGMDWILRASAADNAWCSVCWSPELSLFCAVSYGGTGNRVMTSPDGINWTSRASAADSAWTSVCWSPGLSLFCAVAWDGTDRVMTSPDGIDWTVRVASAKAWRSVCWSPALTLFCAVADTPAGDTVMTSPDGVTWTPRIPATNSGWRSVCWSPALTLFCAVAETGVANTRVMTSPDGITWTTRTMTGSWGSVCWSPELSLFCAVSNNSTDRVMTSPDGITWTVRAIPVLNMWQSVCWSSGASLFVAVSSTGTNDRVMTSPDGITWTVRESAADNAWQSVCWSPRLLRFCAVSFDGDGTHVMTSTSDIDGYTDLTQFVNQTNWRLFHSDSAGAVKELALGVNGQYLKSGGVDTTPLWDTPAGGGDVLGPAGALDSTVPLYDGVTGKLIKDSTRLIEDTLMDDSSNLPDGHAIIAYGDTAWSGDTIPENIKFADNYADLSTAIATIGAAEVTLVITSPESLSDNETFPSTLSVVMEKAGCITIAPGKTLTINGPFRASSCQVFTGSGDVSFGNATVSEVQSTWFGFSPSESAANNDVHFGKVVNSMSAGQCLIIPHGTIPIENVVFNPPDGCSLRAYGILQSSVAGIAFTVGENSGAITSERYNIRGLKVKSATTDYSAGRIGILTYNTKDCFFEIQKVEGFQVGLKVEGCEEGNIYNSFHLGRLVDNKYNLYLTASAGGCVNENSFYGGRFGWTSGQDVTGFKHIWIDYYSINSLNNNKFYNPSLEACGDYAVYAIDCDGRGNVFYTPRFEMGTAKIIQFGSHSSKNRILWGYGFVSYTDVTNDGTYNSFVADDTSRIEGGTADGVLRLCNQSSSAYPVLVVEDSGHALKAQVTGNGQGDFTKLTVSADPTTDDGVGSRLYNDGRYAGGYTNLTQFVDQTNWRLFYSNGAGDVTELALGTSGQYLKSVGTSAIPTWDTPAGAGDVVGPGSATNNAIPLYGNTTGKLIKDSTRLIEDTLSDGSNLPDGHAIKVYGDANWSSGGYTNLTQFVNQTSWRLFYSNSAGNVTELALGTSGQYLKSNGASSIPSWGAPSGSSLWTDESAANYYRPNNVTNSGNTGVRICDAGHTQLGQVSPTTGNNFGGGSCIDGTVLRINDGNVGSSTTNGTVPLWVKRYTNRSGTDWGCGAAYFGAVKTGGTNPLHTVVVDTYCQGGSIPAAHGVLGSMLIHLKNDTCTAANQDIHNIQMITYTPSSNYQGQHCCFTNDVCNRHSDRGWLTRYAAGWTNAFNSSNESSSNYNNSCAYSTGSGHGGGKWYIGYECNSIAYDAGCGKGEGIYFQTSTFDANAVCMRAEGTMTFKDSVTGEKTLAELAGGTGSGQWTDSGQYICPTSGSGYRILDAGTNLNTVTFSANTVFILAPGATYNINSSLIISNTHVSIIGNGATIRKTAQADGLRITGDYCSVQGVEIDGNSQGWAGVFVTGSRNIIDGVIAHNNGGLGIGQDGQSTTCQYNRIVNCESFLNGEIGFSLNDADFAVVSNNVSHDNALEGYTCDSNSPGWASGCVFDGNVGFNNPGGVGGFGIDRARNCVFSNNMIDSSGANDGMKTHNSQGPVEYCIFSGNTLVNNGGYGINITSGTAGASHHNKLVGNVYNGNALGDYYVVSGQSNVVIESVGSGGLWTDYPASNFIKPTNQPNITINDTGTSEMDMLINKVVTAGDPFINKAVQFNLENQQTSKLGWTIYTQLDDYSTHTDGSTALYAKARTFGSSAWAAAIHGEVHDRGSSGTAIAGNFEMWNANSNVTNAYGVVSTIRGSYNGRTAYLVNNNDAKRWTSGIEFGINSCSTEHIKANEPFVINVADGVQNIWLRAANIIPYLSNCTIGTSATAFSHCYITTGHFTTVYASCGTLTCDYVFEDDYELMSLDNLGKHLKKTCALPSMTTNTDRDNLDVGVATEELLVKIEEQTLYILQLHDRMKTLEEKNGLSETLPRTENSDLRDGIKCYSDEIRHDTDRVTASKKGMDRVSGEN